MSTGNRIEALRRMRERRPDDLRLTFGLALEYLRSGDLEGGVRLLREYLSAADDEGNAWSRLGSALVELGRSDEARDAYRRGIKASERHGHPSMAADLRAALDDLSEDRA